jgi:hypothetical protein
MNAKSNLPKGAFSYQFHKLVVIQGGHWDLTLNLGEMTNVFDHFIPLFNQIIFRWWLNKISSCSSMSEPVLVYRISSSRIFINLLQFVSLFLAIIFLEIKLLSKINAFRVDLREHWMLSLIEVMTFSGCSLLIHDMLLLLLLKQKEVNLILCRILLLLRR